MDFQEKIQFNEDKFVDAVNVDTTIKIGADTKVDLNIEYDLNNVLDVTQIFDDERQATKTYRIHGEFEYFSILNGVPTDYKTVEDFFAIPPLSAATKNIFSDLKIYLVRPSSGFTELIANQRYIKNYEIIGEPEDFDIQPAGYATNIFGEQQYSYIVNFDVDIGNMYDGLGFPITELALYVEYQPQTNGDGDNEVVRVKTYNATGGTVLPSAIFNPIPLSSGDTIVGDVIDYEKSLFQQTNFVDPSNDEESILEHYIFTPYGNNLFSLKWKYRPIIPIRLRYFEQEVRRGNTGTTSYEESISIPPYATKIDNDGNYVWREILDNGFFDPIDEIGVSFPFINQKHYVFNNTIFKVQPDLTNANTASVFNQIKFANNTLDSTNPNSDLDNIGDICN